MEAALIKAVRDCARSKTDPEGASYLSISLEKTAQLAGQFNTTKREVELVALENSVIPERYIRNRHSLSAADQSKLLRSHVALVGLGGLGGTVAETLARIGVGTLSLIDGDVFDESNLNRQLFATEHNLCRAKAEAAVHRIREINSSLTVLHHAKKLTAANAAALIDGATVAVDCLDNIDTRFTLEAAARSLGIPLVSAAVGGYAGQLTTIFPEDRGFELIYGSDTTRSTVRGAEARLGNLPFTVSTVASLESAEVVALLLTRASNLRNRLLIIDLLSYSFERIRLI